MMWLVPASVEGRPEKESYRSYFLTALRHALQIKERALLDKLTTLIFLTDNHMERTSIFTHPGSPSLGKAAAGMRSWRQKLQHLSKEGGREGTMVMIQ